LGAITRNIDDDSLCCLPEQVCRGVGSGWIPCIYPPPPGERLCTPCSEQDKMTCWPRINGKQSCCCGTASVALGAIKGSPSRRKERKGVKAVSAKRQTAKESMRVEEIFDRVVARFIGTKHERDIK